jgi:tetratricopeptide (TPR) repeat protein
MIDKYSSKLNADPESKVFAPLGEIYRKLGMYDKALAIYETGLKYNPDYSLGQVGLAQCFYDLEQFQRAYNALKPYFKYNTDNLKFLKLFARICDRLNLLEETLNIQKAILFISPRDQEAIKYIAEFEDKASSPIIGDEQKVFDVEQLDDGVQGWSQLSLVEKSPEEKKFETAVEVSKEASEDLAAPVFSHTLVDLYLKQGAKDKAIGLLEKAVEINPSDKKVIERLTTLRAEVEDDKSSGHDDLMAAFDKSAKQINRSDEDQLEKVNMAFDLFMKQIHLRRDTVLNS